MSAQAKDAAPDLVTIEIDGQEMTAPKGSMIIEAADKAGIAIPRFCYHRKLSIAANCRMCLVDVEKAPKPLPACATPVMDGMKVFTKSRRSQDAQRNVMEFLLINHPLDCPICDQGGECELQDVALQYGRSVSRFTERKRVVADENMGSLIATDMTRCIHCTRCVRFLDEVAGTNELGGIGRGEKTQIGTYIGRSIDSEVSGNIIDLCPVGALTNKPFRYKARAWELRAREGIGSHDALGSNLFWHTRRGEILRIVPRDNDDLNEAWLADRDRYSHTGLGASDRVTAPLVHSGDEWVATDWKGGLQAAANLLKDAGANLATLVSPRTSCEEMILLQALTRGIGSANIDHRLRQTDFADDAARPNGPATSVTPQDIEQADAIVLIGSNLRYEVPLLAARVRKAQLRGAKVCVVNPVDYSFHFDIAEKIIVSPAQIAARVADVANAIEGARAPVVILGEQAANSVHAAHQRQAATKLAEAVGGQLLEIPSGANALGGYAMGCVPNRGPAGTEVAQGLNAAQMLTERQGGYLLYNFEPSLDTAAGAAALETLHDVPVVYVGAYASAEIRRIADVILPIAEWGEAEMSQLALGGHLQQASAAAKPPGVVRPGWKVLRQLGVALGVDDCAVDDLGQVRAKVAQALDGAAEATAVELPDAAEATGIERIVDVPIYAGDVLVRRAEALQATVHAAKSICRLAPADAERIGVANGDRVDVRANGDRARLVVDVSAAVPEGSAWVAAAVAEASTLHAAHVALKISKVESDAG